MSPQGVLGHTSVGCLGAVTNSSAIELELIPPNLRTFLLVQRHIRPPCLHRPVGVILPQIHNLCMCYDIENKPLAGFRRRRFPQSDLMSDCLIRWPQSQSHPTSFCVACSTQTKHNRRGNMKQSLGKPMLLTVEEAATRLGIRPSTIRSWILRKQHLEVVKVGRLIRVTDSSIDDFIARNTIAPKGENN
jgi:excisionase family DNA binding protein